MMKVHGKEKNPQIYLKGQADLDKWNSAMIPVAVNCIKQFGLE
jgi:hypothetical protein